MVDRHLGKVEVRGSSPRRSIGKIKNHCKRFVALHSDNDPYVSLRYADIFRKNLNAEVIIQHNMGHFSGGDGITELPIVFESIMKMLQK